MSTRAIGNVRPSQVVTTFGPGAIVDLESLSVVVAGIDRWRVDEDLAIYEPRLQRALKVRRFFPATPAGGDVAGRRGTVPAFIFPKYQVCPKCNTLSRISEGNAEFQERTGEIVCTTPDCVGRGRYRASTVPAPFVVACPAGHLDDFPWREYVHRGATDCDGRLTLFSAAKTGTVSDLRVRCTCEAWRTVSDAFGENRESALGPCTRRRPWLGNNQDSAACPCSTEVRAMQRGATNAWFPIVRSALAVREAATPIGMALARCSPSQLSKIDSCEKLKMLVELEMFPTLVPFKTEDVWSALQRERGDIPTDELDLRWPEWLALRDCKDATDEKSELFIETSSSPKGFESVVARVVRARRLLEVRALVGFTRIDASGVPTGDASPGAHAPISLNPPDWLPAVEVRGEGIFIELNEYAVSAWELKPEVVERTNAMAEKFRAWEEERDAPPSQFPGARFVLLHSLAHILMRQLALDCGYSASSVRERIYSSNTPDKKMAGILIYTASPDSEGSLGGLVDLGVAERFSALFASALRAAAQCSSDPLCSDHKPDLHATINAAACHACILAPETSCETFNRFIDRNFLVPTMSSEAHAFFQKNTN